MIGFPPVPLVTGWLPEHFFFFPLLWLCVFGFIHNFEVCNLYWALTGSRVSKSRENFKDFILVSWGKQIPDRSQEECCFRETGLSVKVACVGQMWVGLKIPSQAFALTSVVTLKFLSELLNSHGWWLGLLSSLNLHWQFEFQGSILGL